MSQEIELPGEFLIAGEFFWSGSIVVLPSSFATDIDFSYFRHIIFHIEKHGPALFPDIQTVEDEFFPHEEPAYRESFPMAWCSVSIASFDPAMRKSSSTFAMTSSMLPSISFFTNSRGKPGACIIPWTDIKRSTVNCQSLSEPTMPSAGLINLQTVRPADANPVGGYCSITW